MENLWIIWAILILVIMYRWMYDAVSTPIFEFVRVCCVFLLMLEFIAAGILVVRFVTTPFRSYLDLDVNPVPTILVYVIGPLWIGGVFMMIARIPEYSSLVVLRQICNGAWIVVNTYCAHDLLVHYGNFTTLGWKLVLWIISGAIAIMINMVFQEEMEV